MLSIKKKMTIKQYKFTQTEIYNQDNRNYNQNRKSLANDAFTKWGLNAKARSRNCTTIGFNL